MSATENSWTITLEEDPETKDLILPLSDELLKSVGWKEGDTLEWIDNKDGTWTIRKQNESHSQHEALGQS
tara:strand:+ start:633 stop:842 length:210 start_codon:yes stop_codon:yes gene_type:complete